MKQPVGVQRVNRVALHMLAAMVGAATVVAACQSGAPAAAQAGGDQPTSMPTVAGDTPGGQPLAAPPPPGMDFAIFAGGCFWCMEGPFEAQAGVVEVLSGYTGGTELNPTYEQVGRSATGHAEAVRVVFDPTVVSYAQLVEVFWQTHDPTDAGGQFADRGAQYRPAIFVNSDAQRAAAEASRAALIESGRFEDPVVVPVEAAGAFWVAEDYHQDYYRTHADRYSRYRVGSGRHAFLERVWGTDIGAH